MLAKQAARLMAPALPVFAAKAAPTGTARARSLRRTCGSGFTREAGDAVDVFGYCAGFGYKLYLWLRRSFTMAAVFSHYQGIPP